MKTLPPNDSLKASLSSPVGGHLYYFRRVWQTVKCSSNVLNIISQWLHFSIPYKTKVSQSSPDSLRIQGPSKRPSSVVLYPVSSVKEHYRTGGKCKISQVLQSPVSSPQASPKVEASYRPKQVQDLPSRN